MKTLQCTTVMVNCRLKEPSHAPSPAAVPAVVYDVVLGSTVMYPQGGGQPSDNGILTISTNPPLVFNVTDVRSESGVVHHYGQFAAATADPLPEAGTPVEVSVDPRRRALNSALHSAGHLLDSCMRRIGCNLFPTKGYHFPPSPYVEYEGQIPAELKETIVQRLQEAVTDAIARNEPVAIRPVAPSDLQSICDAGLFAHGNPYASLPEVRVVTLAGAACPCGGTHVTHVGDLKQVVIEKVKAKGKNIRVSYALPTFAA
eukprot:GAFH01004040.1.p1 GENE.GAFH01004040.1~~GAFH01004040.1.p1  ORF type:complete len:275 (-),score=8.93 GAFH01004040.1:19-792(-)